MPAQRPRASFEPIPPDFNLKKLVEDTENFDYVDRISYEMIEEQGIEIFEKLVLLRVIVGGKPLIIDGFDVRLDPWTFTPRWLRDNHGKKVENARDLTAKQNLPLTLGHYLKNLGALTEQFFGKQDNYKDKNRQRMYLKDIDCPPVWQDKLREHIPDGLFYLNESTGVVGGPGAVLESVPNMPGKRKGKGIAIAGDLMSSLPPEMRAENLMCYIGHEGTYTPAHREMCASLGQNIMVEASGTIGEDGKPERPGSSIWFMTESNDRHLVAEYWLSVLGHDIEIESHFAQVVAWKRAPFKTYVVEQKPGDFILIPPLAPHQVWNRGTRTMKVAWNRTTVETLEMALNEALPNARMVCRDEQYKNKAIIYYTLQKYSALLASARSQSEVSTEAATTLRQSGKVRQLVKDFKRLFAMFKSIMLSEMFNPEGTQERPEFLAFDSNVTCAYCRGNIFNRFLSCPACKDALGTDTEEPYDVCMECYAMGRSCGCISKLRWVEQWKWKELCKRYEDWRKQIIALIGSNTDTSFLPLQDERKRQVKKSLAQVCQEQLKLRPWVDIKSTKRDQAAEDEEAEVEVNDDGTIKKSTKRLSKAYLKSHHHCHVCQGRHPLWKMGKCQKCEKWWCYGSLFRAHDLMPQTVMEDPNWECPHCRQVCSTGRCREDPRQHPYEPKGTLLGHDTRKVADARSVESLVDFSLSNLTWIREKMDERLETSRLKKRREEAEKAKLNEPMLDEDFTDGDGGDTGPSEHATRLQTLTTDHIDPDLSRIEYSPVDGSIGAIDPRLIDLHPRSPTDTPNGRFSHPTEVENGSNSFPVMYDGTSNHGHQSPLFAPEVNSEGLVDYQATAAHALAYPYMQQGAGSEHNFLYPDPNILQEHGDPSRKRPAQEDGLDEEHIKLLGHKKRKKNGADAPGSQQRNGTLGSEASKEFLKEKQKRALEEAKKAGRLIQVHAAMKGKHKVVKLNVGVAAMSQLQASWNGTSTLTGAPSLPITDSAADGSNADQVIIRSDVGPAPKTQPAVKPAPKPAQKQVRIRVEKDDDFDVRDVRRPAPTGAASKTRSTPRYEEVTVASDEDEDEVLPATGQKGSGRRISSWLARKNQGSGDSPTELPSNWKDGRGDRRATLPAPKRPEKPENVTKSSPLTSSAPPRRPGPLSSRPIGPRKKARPPPPTESTKDSTEDSSVPEKQADPKRVTRSQPPSESTKTPDVPAKQAAVVNGDKGDHTATVIVAKSAAAIMEEENRRAKLQAAHWAERGFESDGEFDSDPDSGEQWTGQKTKSTTAIDKGQPIDDEDSSAGAATSTDESDSDENIIPARRKV